MIRSLAVEGKSALSSPELGELVVGTVIDGDGVTLNQLSDDSRVRHGRAERTVTHAEGGPQN